MVAPLLLFLASFVACVAALILPGQSDLVLLAGPCALASLFLLLQAATRRMVRRPVVPKGPAGQVAPTISPQFNERSPGFSPFRALRREKPKWILVDGSNVLYWKDGTPQIDTLREVLGHLTARGYTPGVVFDANAGYLISGKYQHDGALGLLLGLAEDRVMVVGKGLPADTILLAAARDLGARIVTNDRYRDWVDTHPEVREPGHLIRGGFCDTGLWIDLEEG